MTRVRLAAALALSVFFVLAPSAAALAPAGGGWVWQNPLPFGWDLSEVTFSDRQHAWAATFTGGTVLRSSDAGLTWQPSFTGVTGAMWDLSAPDGLHAAVLYTQTSGYRGADVVAFTSDGGSTWTPRTFSPDRFGGLIDIDFVGPAECRLATSSGLFASSDGGASWMKVRTPVRTLNEVDFIDPAHGWIVTMAGRAFYTADGGVTWAERTPPGRNEWVFVTAADAGSAWARIMRKSGDDVILRTIDAGRTWQRRFAHEYGMVQDLQALSRDEAWLVTDESAFGGTIGGPTPSENPGSSLRHTTDGGTTWDWRALGQDFPGQLAVSSDGVTVAAGTSLWRSPDRGVTWSRLTGGGDHSLRDVDFVDAVHGWAVGQRADRLFWADPLYPFGAVLRAVDGTRWEDAELTPGPVLNAVSFPDEAHGWAVGESGRVVRSVDGGSTWTDLPAAGAASLVDVSFADDRHGWALALSATMRSSILRTADGGATWTATPLPARQEAVSVCFVSATRGWVCGAAGGTPDSEGPLLLETTDGGITWVQRSAGKRMLNEVTFVDESHGWLLQEGVDNLGSVLRTEDGGATWQTATLPGPSYAYAEGMAFADAEHGWLAGDRVWKTTDGGATWSIDGAQVAPWFVDQTLSAVAAQPGGAAWAVGEGGRIISTVDTNADTAAPQTVDDGDRVWRRAGATVNLSASDIGGGSVARTEYRVDGEAEWHAGTAVSFGAPADHFGDGAHTVRYRSVDDAGNVERTRVCPVLIDTTAPWAGPGDDARVRRGAKVTLRYDLADNLSPDLWVSIEVHSFRAFWSGGKPVRTFRPGLQALGRRGVKFRCNLRRGWYLWSVSATDLAGNEFVPWANGFLEVR